MICELTNKIDSINCFIITGKKMLPMYYKCEYNLLKVLWILFLFILIVIFISWWSIPLIYLCKIEKPSINWPVFRCKK